MSRLLLIFLLVICGGEEWQCGGIFARQYGSEKSNLRSIPWSLACWLMFSLQMKPVQKYNESLFLARNEQVNVNKFFFIFRPLLDAQFPGHFYHSQFQQSRDLCIYYIFPLMYSFCPCIFVRALIVQFVFRIFFPLVCILSLAKYIYEEIVALFVIAPRKKSGPEDKE